MTTYDGIGGAGTAVRCLADQLAELGYPVEIRSRWHAPADPNAASAEQIDASAENIATSISRMSMEPDRPFGLSQLPTRVLQRIQTPWESRLNSEANRSSHWSIFSDRRTPSLAGHPEALFDQHGRAIDVFLLSWVARFIDLPKFFRQTRTRPKIWRIPDLHLATGGCHSPNGCEQFVMGCRDCPPLESAASKHRVQQNWQWKHDVFRRLPKSELTLVAQSQWARAKLEKHPSLSRFPMRIIPNGVDRRRFHPRGRDQARAWLGEQFPGTHRLQPSDVLALLIVGWDEPRRGSRALWKAIDDRLANDVLSVDRAVATASPDPAKSRSSSPRRKRRLVIVGDRPPDDLPRKALSEDRWVQLPKQSWEDMPRLFRAVDVMLYPHLEENGPNTVLESIGSGTPVAAFASTGADDLLHEPVAGRLFPLGDFESIADWFVAAESFSDSNADTISGSARDLSTSGRQYGELIDSLVTSASS
ncbi:MAG: glycosyltransferase [Planctomycetota bacterium]